MVFMNVFACRHWWGKGGAYVDSSLSSAYFDLVSKSYADVVIFFSRVC